MHYQHVTLTDIVQGCFQLGSVSVLAVCLTLIYSGFFEGLPQKYSRTGPLEKKLD